MTIEQQKKNVYRLNCAKPSINRSNRVEKGKNAFYLVRHADDPSNTNRLMIKHGEISAELFPTKGLSLAQVTINGKKLFWDAPYGLTDQDKLDLWSDEVLINGKPEQGFTFLKTFSAGIELYGLKNWGMPYTDSKTGEFYPLHGETSNIPVPGVIIEFKDDALIVSSEYQYHEMNDRSEKPWYRAGRPLFLVKKEYIFKENPEPEIVSRDTIVNITDETLTPDWGYHITFHPLPGTKLKVPSSSVEVRGGGNVPDEIETWQPQAKPAFREETGIIQKGLKIVPDNGKEVNQVLITHPDGTGFTCSFPPSPYFQTWHCRGGAGSDEFKLVTGESLLQKNWDGIGIEIGSSALDHDGNIDTSVDYKPDLEPGESKTIEIKIALQEKAELELKQKEILEYNKNRKTIQS
ncbi:MAG: DUF4432 family protein [Bacteroidales bacterium]